MDDAIANSPVDGVRSRPAAAQGLYKAVRFDDLRTTDRLLMLGRIDTIGG